VNNLPSDLKSESSLLAARYGTPLYVDVTVGSSALWRKRARRAEVCMVIRRPADRVLTFTKTFYPPDVLRLLTGGVEVGEPVLDALHREVAEETSLTVRVERFLALIAYRPDDIPGADPCFFSFAFLLEPIGGTLAAADPAERVDHFADTPIADLPRIADHLDALPDDHATDLDEPWSDWGHQRAVMHRTVHEALTTRTGQTCSNA
jgi:8-oxo-dGTP pyrophosphatase MutT (NUDIX family)